MNRTLLFIFIMLALNAKAQQKLSYTYDDAGNRIKRAIVMEARSVDVDDTEEELFFEDRIANRQLKIYPNPVKEQLTIQLPGYESSVSGEFILFNISGSVLHKGVINSEITRVDMNRFTIGTYVLHIIIAGERTVWKIIKQ